MVFQQLFLTLAPAALAQNPITVEWNNPAADYQTISDAVQDPSIGPGSTIQVRGFEIGGFPGAYAEHDPNGANMEAFPLPIPEGVSLVADPTGPRVYIWTDGTSGTPQSLVRLGTTDETGKPHGTIRGITLGGGLIGIEVAPPFASDDEFDCTIDDVIFVGNRIGLSSIASHGGQLEIDVEHCKFHNIDFNPNNLAVPPVLESPSIGLQFHAIDSTAGVVDPPQIDATVLDLKVLGTPQVMQQDVWRDHADFALVTNGVVGSSRLIEVFVQGDGTTTEHRTPQNPPPPPYTPPVGDQPICQVDLEVLGSTLDGRNVEAGKGWDIGLYCSAAPASDNTTVYDYLARYDVLVSGTSAKNFRYAGFYPTVTEDCRGRLEVVSSDVSAIGKHLSSTLGILGSGIHAFALEGYLALVTNSVRSHGNEGSGITAHCPASTLGSMDFPVGLYVQLDETECDHNVQDGVFLVGPDQFLTPAESQAAIVGGTWDNQFSGSNKSLARTTQKQFFGQEYGPGRINRCQLHHNGRDGVRVTLADMFNVGAFASILVVNTIIWENQETGITFHRQMGNGGSARFLVPISHCTIAHNGTSSPGAFSSLAFTKSPTTSNVWDDHWGYNDPSGVSVTCKILNSVFELTAPVLVDFNHNARTICVDDNPVAPPAFDQIGIRGIRATWNSGGGSNPPGGSSTYRATPFAYLDFPSLSGASKYLLTTNQSAPFWLEFADATPMSYSLLETQSASDFANNSRPGATTGLRDKGAHEVNL